MGLGMVRFARDEKERYEALLESGGAKRAMGGYMKELRRRLATPPVLGDLDPAVLDSVFERMWLFTLGLAMAMRHGFVKDLDDETLFLLMSSQGAIATVAEAEAEGKLGSGKALFTAFLSRRKNVAGKRHAKPAKK